MLADKLRKSVLQAAIQGQLTEQLPTDGDAKDLLKKICAEKAKLIAEKKIKVQPLLPPISDDELPFAIPANWCRVRLGDICNLSKGNKLSDTSLPYLDAKYLRGLKEKNLYINGNCVEKGKRIILVDGENSGEIFEVPEKGFMGSTFLALDISDNVRADFFQYAVSTKKDFFGNNKRGSAIPHLDKKLFFATLIPLPPLAEQERIVARLDKILSEIELLANDERELTDLEENFPRQMKKSLLQAAIQGQLTEQLPTDGDAKDLLKKIQAEKAKLITAKKIKATPLPPISDDEIPFTIPENWCWVRLGEIFNVSSGINLTAKQMTSTGYPVYGGNGIAGYYTKKFINKDSLLIGRVGFHCGNIQKVVDDCWVTDNALIVKFFSEENVCLDFFYYLLQQINLRKLSVATAQPVISAKRIYSTLIPLPPLAEQERIVARLDELLPLCEI